MLNAHGRCENRLNRLKHRLSSVSLKPSSMETLVSMPRRGPLEADIEDRFRLSGRPQPTPVRAIKSSPLNRRIT